MQLQAEQKSELTPSGLAKATCVNFAERPMPKMILLPVMIVFMLQLFAGSAAAQQGEEKFLMPKVPGYVTGFVDRTSKMLMIEKSKTGQCFLMCFWLIFY